MKKRYITFQIYLIYFFLRQYILSIFCETEMGLYLRMEEVILEKIHVE